jgi:pilus assembly protein FimV
MPPAEPEVETVPEVEETPPVVETAPEPEAELEIPAEPEVETAPEVEEAPPVVEAAPEPEAELETLATPVEPVVETSPALEEEVDASAGINEDDSDRLADTAELALEPGREQSAWALVTETVELQQVVEDESLLEDDEADADDTQALSTPDADLKPAVKEAKSPSPTHTKSGKSIDAIKAGIMGVINPDHLKPVDPNTYQDQR